MTRNQRRKAKALKDMDAANTALFLAAKAKRNAIVESNLSRSRFAPRSPCKISSVYSGATAPRAHGIGVTH